MRGGDGVEQGRLGDAERVRPARRGQRVDEGGVGDGQLDAVASNPVGSDDDSGGVDGAVRALYRVVMACAVDRGRPVSVRIVRNDSPRSVSSARTRGTCRHCAYTPVNHAKSCASVNVDNVVSSLIGWCRGGSATVRSQL